MTDPEVQSAVPAARTASAPPFAGQPCVIKLHTFTTDAGFTPNYGDVSADFRGNPGDPGSLCIGSAQGDEHHCIKQWAITEAEIPAFLASAPLLNSQFKARSGSVITSELEALLGGVSFLGGLVAEVVAMFPLPTLRIGLWYPHA